MSACNCKGGRCSRCNSKQVNSNDVYYSGSYLPNIAVESNMTLTTILNILNIVLGQSGITPIRLIATAGSTITDFSLTGKTVLLIVIDDITKNTGFTKITSSPTINFTDGTSLVDGQVITIFAT